MAVLTAQQTADQTDLQTMLQAAMSAVGVNYVWGGNSLMTGVDCSGLVQQAFRAAGYELPRVTYGQVGAGIQVDGITAAQPGDLIFYPTGWGGQNSHVAIYLGDGQMLEAPRTGLQVRVTGVRPGGNIRRIIGVMGKNGTGGGVQLGPNKQAMGTVEQITAMTSMAATGQTPTDNLQADPGGPYANMEAISGFQGMQPIGNPVTAAGAGMSVASPSRGLFGSGSATPTPPTSSTTSPTSAGAGGALTYIQAYQLMINAGATPEEARMLAAIAGPESGYRPDAVSRPNTNGTIDRGLWQINSVHSQYDQAKLLDPTYNAQAALEIYRSQGPTAWSVYNSGAYRAYLTGVGGKS